MKYFLIFLGIILFQHSYAQEAKYSAFYKERAELMFQKVWQHYRVPQHSGLFSEHYPTGGRVNLDYFQGAGVKEKEVSFLWPFSGVFSAANVLIKYPDLQAKYKKYLDTLSIGVLAYRDTTRIPVGYQAYPATLEKSDRYYDDNGLVCIDYVEAYFNTKDATYITKAKEVFNFIISGWDDKLGGGVYWLEGHKDQKPACSNGMATLAALKLYQATKEPFYLTWGTRFYNWMHSTLRNPDGIYYNDVKMDGKPNETYYTYNTGSMLEAAVLMYHFTADQKYLKEAQLVASNSFGFFSEEHHGVRQFKIDLPWFVTVLFRGYEALYKVDRNPRYINAVAANLDRAWQESADRYGFLTAKWATDDASKRKPKWLLDEACIAELYGRMSLLNIKSKQE
ncbi:glycoside hydrolase family 76 protein [Pedobacter endophyticus]|uniref:AGE family epimerase/isomerase n=1 Tax=Pedobacter endophyticus TaxID=2789740 RepID=A0A7S9L1L9_9SPHI|nr:glycoside hydrolase family 76 protein [Pedobacter endophyticus]QPH40854.1 AGE family epimerase/isomerase [Pedobacter endophyticus]